MKITPEPPEQAVRCKVPLYKMQGYHNSVRDLHARIGPKVEARGYRWGLFRGSWKCPVKDGDLRFWWMKGCAAGRYDRARAKRRRTSP